MIPEVFIDAWRFLFSLDEYGLLRTFWFFIFLDLPRYLITDTYLFFHEIYVRLKRNPDSRFILRLKNDPPLVTVVVPVYNEEETIAWTIRSLLEQTYGNLEIIIVDDGSTDDTPKICKNISNRPNITSMRLAERAGKSAVLNYGMNYANGEFIIFVDSDTTFDRDAIYHLMTEFADPVVGGVSGNLRPRNASQNLLTRLQQIEYLFTISVGRRIRSSFNILPIISGAFGGFRRELIAVDAIGGHEPGPGNDSDLAIRVRKLGYKIAFQPRAMCLTKVPETPYKLMRQRSRWDRNMIKNRIRKHKNVFNPFSKGFRLVDAITFIDSVFFHILLSFSTILYLLDIYINYREYLMPLLFVNFCLYFCAELMELFFAVALSRRYQDFRLFLYVPLINPFKIILKFVRIKAYLQELIFRYSNLDPFAPIKVRQKYIQW